MKNIFKSSFFLALFSCVVISCVSDSDDTDIPALKTPVYKETFANSNFSNWTKFSSVGAQVWTLDTRFGYDPSNSDIETSCAKISGYSGGNNENVDWLISPAIDLSNLSKAYLSFYSAYNFSGPTIEVYMSNNYPGEGDPQAAGVNWTKIEGVTLPPDDNYLWAKSGDLDVSSFTGVGNTAVHVAFKYTSTSSAGSTWEIDEVRIKKPE